MIAGTVAVDKTGPSQLKLEPTDSVAEGTLLLAEVSESITQTANQLALTSPVTKKRSVEEPIRTEYRKHH